MRCKECGHPVRRRAPSGTLTVTPVRGGVLQITKGTLRPAGIHPGDRVHVRVLRRGVIVLYAAERVQENDLGDRVQVR